MELGGIEFMNKPFNPRQLVAVLESLVTDPLPPLTRRQWSPLIRRLGPGRDGPARR